MRMNKILLICVICLSAISVYAQEPAKESYRLPDNWYVNANFGSSLFWGDLRVNDLWPVDKNNNERKWAYGGILGKKITPWLDLRGQFLFGELSGTKRTVNEYFNSEYYEYNLGLVIDWVNIIYKYNPNRKINAYTLIGVGNFLYRTQKRDLRTNAFIAGTAWNVKGEKTSMKSETVIPLGLGLKYNIDRRFSITGEVIWKYTNTDDVDLTRGMSKHDMYSYMSLGLSYRFNIGNKNRDMYQKNNNINYNKEKNSLYEKERANLTRSVDSLAEVVNLKQMELADCKNSEKELVKVSDSLKRALFQNSKKAEEVKVAEQKREETVNELAASLREVLKKLNPSDYKVEDYKEYVKISLQGNLLYKSGSWSISVQGQKALNDILSILEKNNDIRIEVTGHTDNTPFTGKGMVKNNQDLSVMRAYSICQKIMEKSSVKQNRVKVMGMGSSQPVAENSTPENKAKNRRTEIIIYPLK
jgi:chemotaxis protein MotB